MQDTTRVAAAAKKEEEEDDDDIDLFGSDEEEVSLRISLSYTFGLVL